MSLLDTLRSGIKLADKITKPLQSTVTYERAMGTDGYGGISYASSVQMRAIVDYASKMVRTQSGELTVTRATVTLLDVDEIIRVTSGNGIGNNDRFTLQDGDTGAILDISGFIDAGTGNPVATTVMLG
jgi:hypothetical protein